MDRRSATGNRWLWIVACLLVCVVCVFGSSQAASAQDGADDGESKTLLIDTLPPTSGLKITIDGQTMFTRAAGGASFELDDLTAIVDRIEVDADLVVDSSGSLRSQFTRLYRRGPDHYTIAVDRFHPVEFSFRGTNGEPIGADRIEQLNLKSSIGDELNDVDTREPLWVHSQRVVSTQRGPEVRDIEWSVSSAFVRSSNVVNRSQIRFFPAVQSHLEVPVLFFSMKVSVHDMFFQWDTGERIEFTYPDGDVISHSLTDGAMALDSLPRGKYEVVVVGSGPKIARPVVLSRNQEMDLEFLSWIDIGVVGVVGLLFASLPLIIGRRNRLRRSKEETVLDEDLGGVDVPDSGFGALTIELPAMDISSFQLEAVGEPADRDVEADEAAGSGGEPVSDLGSLTIELPEMDVKSFEFDVAHVVDHHDGYRTVELPASGGDATSASEPDDATNVGATDDPDDSEGKGGNGDLKGLIHLALIVMLAAASLLAALPPTTAAAQAQPGDPVVLAHYYIWFEPTSWNRAKSDYPAAGRYSSDQIATMRGHVELAQSVGIDGFIVSWKSTEVLDPRLENLIAIAEELDFKLAITYQGLDFNREPLPPARIGDDLDLFVERYAESPAFDLFDKPLVAWSGTWEYEPNEIAVVTSARSDHLLILATEKNVDGYQRIGESVDGNLYYWSSVNPETFPGYPMKLIEMGNAVRSNGGLWIAPVAPGFDARLIGGNTVVERRGGTTLRSQWNAALASVPHAIGIISWNEFSENTHIEPSESHGNQAIRVIADLTSSPLPAAVDFDSSGPQGEPETESQALRVLALGGLSAVILVSPLVVAYRRRFGTRA